MGRIACCNVLSDLYAMGIDTCDNMLMLLGVSTKLSDDESRLIVPKIMAGFRDCAAEAGTTVQGGQTVLNPWLIIGGVATTVCGHQDMVMPHNAEPGDLLVLTKPLGTQVAVNVHQWMEAADSRWQKLLISSTTSADQTSALFEAATQQMARLNRHAARLMRKYGAHAATDITGFGLVGHANNLAEAQTRPGLRFLLHRLPCLRGTVAMDAIMGSMFRLAQGLSAETSGGLLVALAPSAATHFVDALPDAAWIVGTVESIPSSVSRAVLSECVEIVEVDFDSQ